jgi:hypothetical protein
MALTGVPALVRWGSDRQFCRPTGAGVLDQASIGTGSIAETHP